jgi:hemolysin III
VDGSSTVTAASSSTALAEQPAAARPLLRGLSHQLAFFIAVPLGVMFALHPATAAGRGAAIAYGATVAFMFGASGAYHRITWSLRWRPLARRVDHAGIYLLIAGSYTPVGLLVLGGAWRLAVLSIVWAGAVLAILVRVCWIDAPKWLASTIAITLGWVGIAVLPQIVSTVGATGCLLLVAGGIAYTIGGIVYATERPDPVPAVFGYHEVFHAFVILAVALQYTAIAFFVLPSH